MEKILANELSAIIGGYSLKLIFKINFLIGQENFGELGKICQISQNFVSYSVRHFQD